MGPLRPTRSETLPTGYRTASPAAQKTAVTSPTSAYDAPAWRTNRGRMGRIMVAPRASAAVAPISPQRARRARRGSIAWELKLTPEKGPVVRARGGAGPAPARARPQPRSYLPSGVMRNAQDH